MHARRDHHVGAGQHGRLPARWRAAAAVVAAAALSLAAAAVPAPAAGGYTVTATIPVGSGPWGVAADPAAGTVYVTNTASDTGPNTVSVIDVATSRVIGAIPVGYGTPEAVAVDPAAGTVYVTNGTGYVPNWPGNTVSVIDAATSTVTATIPSAASRTRWRRIPPPGPSTWATPALARCR
jgi:YVTN family beta-propeller protein